MKSGRRITQDEIAALNQHLLKRHPSVRLYNIINVNREYSLSNIVWTFVKKDGHITCKQDDFLPSQTNLKIKAAKLLISNIWEEFLILSSTII